METDTCPDCGKPARAPDYIPLVGTFICYYCGRKEFIEEKTGNITLVGECFYKDGELDKNKRVYGGSYICVIHTTGYAKVKGELPGGWVHYRRSQNIPCNRIEEPWERID